MKLELGAERTNVRIVGRLVIGCEITTQGARRGKRWAETATGIESGLAVTDQKRAIRLSAPLFISRKFAEAAWVLLRGGRLSLRARALLLVRRSSQELTRAEHRLYPPQSRHLRLNPFNTLTMFRTALLRSARQAVRAAPRWQTPIARPVAQSSLLQAKHIAPSARFQAVRCYASSAGLSKDEVEGRIMDLLKNFDKVMAR